MKLLIQIACLLACTFAYSTQTIDKIIPRSEEQIDDYVEEAVAYFHKEINVIRALSPHEMTFDNTFGAWIDLRNYLLVKSSILLFAGSYEEGLAQVVSEKAFTLGLNFVDSVLKDARLSEVLLSYAHKALDEKIPLTAYQWYIVDTLLQECEARGSDLSVMRKRVEQHEMLPYHYKRGNGVEKKLSENDADRCFTVLNLNTCMQKDEQCYLFGGVRSWQERVDGIAENLLALGADVICLQEVHEEEANEALYERLKNHYVHFYMGIGPRSCGLGVDTLGLPSGLFIASKYPLENPTFTLFSEVGLQMNFGFFDFIVKNGSESLGHVYTTHMQSLDFEGFDEIRGMELMEILSKMKKDSQLEKNIPFFLCGDLNIPWGSEEPGEKMIRSQFYDAYNRDRKEVTPETRTCTNFFIDQLLIPTREISVENVRPQILDYALLLDDSEYMIDTQLLPMNDILQPEQALTDHHGLVTRIRRI